MISSFLWLGTGPTVTRAGFCPETTRMTAGNCFYPNGLNTLGGRGTSTAEPSPEVPLWTFPY